jgi:mono/diheme cytochrome c family protein
MMRITTRKEGWSGAVVALAASLACACLAACGGSKSNAGAAQGGTDVASATVVPAAENTVPAAADPNGRQIYQRCAVCHQATGLGLPGAFPPLAGSEWTTTENVAVPIRIVLRGLQGAVTVKGQRFNSAMPAYGTNQPLSDAEVAAVLTYVRSAWGNTASAVTGEQVETEHRATASHTAMWTAGDLQPLLKTGGH